MQQKRRKKRRSGGSAALALLLFTAIVIAAGVGIAHRREERGPDTGGFVQDDDKTQTEARDLGKFEWGVDASIDMPSASNVHDYAEGEDYAYAYAGFTPKLVDLSARKWELMLVNRDYILPQDYSPELAEAAAGTGVRMDARVAPKYQEMYDAAKKDGVTLTPLSGHRRISTQKTNFENKISYYMGLGNDRKTATQKAAQIILPPGTSEHNAGLAMDIISLDVSFENTAAFRWLQAHAQDYGFILRYPKDKESITAITYEPWHWRYVGVEDAVKIKQSGQCLEEYLGVVSR